MQRWTKLIAGSAIVLASVSAPLSAGAMVVQTPWAQLSPAIAAPAGAVYQGSLDGSTAMSLRVVLQPRNVAALKSFISAVATPGNALYHHYLAKGQFASIFGPTNTTIAAVTSTLRASGLSVSRPSSNGMVLTVRGTSDQVAHAFATRFGSYRTTTGTTGYVADAAVKFPATLAASIAGVTGLSSFAHAVSYAQEVSHAALSTPTTCSAATSANSTRHEFLPSDIDQMYGVDKALANGYDGTGRTVALVEFSSYYPSDVTAYFNCFGLTNTVTNVLLNGGAGASSASSGGMEVELDIQMIAGVAPGATILDYEHPNDGSAFIDTFNAIASDHTADAVSVSWGECESQTSSSGEQPILMQMAAQGQSVFVAAGDSGSSSCAYNAKPGNGNVDYSATVDDPANSPWVTAIGGVSVSSISPLSQSVWNDLCGGGVPCGGGGGASSEYAHPSWQVGSGTDSSLGRQVPDLSVIGDPATGMLTYWNGGFHGVGGTSIGAPLVAALTAVSAQSCGVQRLGFLDPRLYQMGLAHTGFNDVTAGSNDLYGIGSYFAESGYDMASGLGTPDPNSFIGDLCATLPSATADSFGTGAASTWTYTYTNGSETLTAGTGTITLNGFVAGGFSSNASDYTVNGTNPINVTVSGTTVTLALGAQLLPNDPVTIVAHGVVNSPSTGTVVDSLKDNNGYQVFFPVTFVASTVGTLTAQASTSAGSGSTGALFSATVLNAQGDTLAGIPVTVKVTGHGTAVPLDGGVSDLHGVAHFRIVDALAEATTVTAQVGGTSSSAVSVTFSNPYKVTSATLNPKAGALVGQAVSSSMCGLVARTSKGAIYSSMGGLGLVNPATGAAKIPLAASDPAVANSPNGGCDIAYVDKSGKVELVNSTGGSVVVTNLASALGGTAMVASPGILVSGNTVDVFALTKAGSLYLLTSTNNGAWIGTNMTASAAAPKVTGAGYALASSVAFVGGQPEVALRTGPTALLYAYDTVFSSWQATDLVWAAFIDNSGSMALTGNATLSGGATPTIYVHTASGHFEVLLPDPMNYGFFIGDDVTNTYGSLKVKSDAVVLPDGSVGVLVGTGFDLITTNGAATQPYLPVSLSFAGVKGLYVSTSGSLVALAGTKVGTVSLK